METGIKGLPQGLGATGPGELLATPDQWEGKTWKFLLCQRKNPEIGLMQTVWFNHRGHFGGVDHLCVDQFVYTIYCRWTRSILGCTQGTPGNPGLNSLEAQGFQPAKAEEVDQLSLAEDHVCFKVGMES